MDQERLSDHCTEETLLPRWTIMRVEVEAGQRMYVATEIRKNGQDPYSKFVVENIGSLNKQLLSLNAPISRHKSPGQLRSKREIRDIKVVREKQKRQIPHVLNVLCGREKLNVRFIKDLEGKIHGVDIELPNGNQSSLSAGLRTSL